jgi:hypothetical protein
VGACLEFCGSRNNRGYGKVTHRQKSYLAHRLVAELTTGCPLRRRDVVMHECDNPRCINPCHLKVATQSENIKDAYTKGRR